jgi:hypothetical protein
VEQRAQLEAVCQQATSIVDGYLHQPLRATITTEQFLFPGHPRASMDRGTGIVSLVSRRWPVTAVNAVQVSPARAFPAQWALVAAGNARIRTPVLQPASGMPVQSASGGNMIDIAPGAITGHGGSGHGRGPGAWLLAASITAAYPHTMLTAAAPKGATEVQVEDVTGWEWWSGFLLDGPATEFATGTATDATSPPPLPGAGGTVQAGPGMVALSSPLEYGHQPGTLLSAIPGSALQAVALKVAVVALETLTAIAAQSANSQMLPGGLGALAFEAEASLEEFCRRA